MPMVMMPHSPMEIIVLQEPTIFRVDHIRDTLAHLHDGRDWPKEIEPRSMAIPRPLERYMRWPLHLLEFETRFKGPRFPTWPAASVHRDNQSSQG